MYDFVDCVAISILNYNFVVYLLLVLYLAAVYLRTFRFKRVAKKSYDLRTLFSPRNGRSLHIFVIFKNNGSLCVSMSYQNTHI